MDKNAKYIKKIEINNFRSVDSILIDCSHTEGDVNQWTFIVGDNNTGKTGILKAIADLRPVIYKAVVDEDDEPDLAYAPVGGLSFKESIDISVTIQGVDSCWSYNSYPDYTTMDNAISDFVIYGYGVSRYPASTTLSEKTEADDCASLFSANAKLLNIEEWIIRMDYALTKNNQDTKSLHDKLKKIICDDVLFPEIDDFKVEFDNDSNPCVLFQTKDTWCRFEDLGFGYKSMMSWVVDLCSKMFNRYPDSEDPLKEPAIVLVDEIDLNLHPQWQREICPKLSSVFENTQFIATTHSPFILQSMSNINLFVLTRDEESDRVNLVGVVDYDCTNLPIDEILSSKYFGVPVMGREISDLMDKQTELYENGDFEKADEIDSLLFSKNPKFFNYLYPEKYYETYRKA